jgi:hypothetical protein
MRRAFVSLALVVFMLSFSPPAVHSQQDPSNVQCCVHEFWAGVELGWASSLLYPFVKRYAGLPSGRVNFWVTRLYEAAHGIEGAHKLCSARNPAWPNWYDLQNRLYQMGDQMIRSCGGTDPNPSPTCETTTRGMWHTLNGTYAGWGNALALKFADRSVDRVTEYGACDPDYFKLGWRLAYAHYQLQAGDRGTADTHLGGAILHINNLRECKPWSAWCVALWDPRLPIYSGILRARDPSVSNQEAVRLIWEVVIRNIEQTLNFGRPDLRIRPCPGTADQGTIAAEFLAGRGRGHARLRAQPTVPPGPPPIAQPLPTPPIAPPVRTPPPVRPVNLSGTWVPAGGGKAVVVITGSGSSYRVTGTDGNFKNEGTVSGDGIRFEGWFKDVPGWCCKREGYVWIEAVDENTYRARSVWWTPGSGSREKPHLTYGWTTFKRSAR